MKKLFVFAFLFLISIISFAQQSGDIMYFAEWADGRTERGLSDRFSAGKLAVICKLVKPLQNKHVYIQLDKYNFRTYYFEYYQRYEFWKDPSKKYLSFNDIVFDSPGFYRVFLLDDNHATITSALIEIIEPKYLQQKK